MSIQVHDVTSIQATLYKESVLSVRRIQTHSFVSTLLSVLIVNCGAAQFGSLVNNEQTVTRDLEVDWTLR